MAGKPVDVWACGVTLFAMIYGHVPFLSDNLVGIYEAIRSDPLVFPEGHEIPPDLKDLIILTLDKNPNTRITVPAIKAYMDAKFPQSSP